MEKKEQPKDKFQIAYDALRDIDLYADVADPAATAKQLAGIASNALGKINEIQDKEYNWLKHGDFCKYYDTAQKRNIWVLGYFGGSCVEAFNVARQYAEATGVDINTVKIDEILKSRRYKSFKYIMSTEEQEMETDVKLINIRENVWALLTD